MFCWVGSLARGYIEDQEVLLLKVPFGPTDVEEGDFVRFMGDGGRHYVVLSFKASGDGKGALSIQQL